MTGRGASPYDDRMSSEPHHDRLSALDAFLLEAEDAFNPMHVGAVMIFDAGPLRRPDGELDIERLQRHVRSRLESLPRYRQRLERVPVFHHPVWVDDDRFDIRTHVRTVRLPSPGGPDRLRAQVGELLASPLPRDRPLWELCFVDGLDEDRFALVAKVHHCIVDGVLGAAVIASVLESEPSEGVDEPAPWEPRPVPSARILLEDEVRYRGERTAELIRRGLAWIERDDREAKTQMRELFGGLLSYLKAVVPSSPTPLNPDHIGAQRAFDWVSLDMERIKNLRRRVGCTVNDLVIATVAGAVRRHLLGNGVDVEGMDFRVMVPVSEHGRQADLEEGNRVSIMIVRLPVDEEDPQERLRLSIRAMQDAKASKQADSLAMLEELADWTMATLLAEAAHRMMHLRPFNLVVTNVPGPPMPLYMLGARLLEAYPLVPLFVNTGVGIALLSYCGRLGVGVNIDPEHIRDADVLVRGLDEAFDELERAVPVSGEAPNEVGAR